MRCSWANRRPNILPLLPTISFLHTTSDHIFLFTHFCVCVCVSIHLTYLLNLLWFHIIAVANFFTVNDPQTHHNTIHQAYGNIFTRFDILVSMVILLCKRSIIAALYLFLARFLPISCCGWSLSYFLQVLESFDPLN